MPIKAENQKRYPENWAEIVERIRERSGDHCEGSPAYPECRAANREPHPVTGSMVVLTTGHLDHTPENCGDDNLRHWCQRCHLTYDSKHHAQTAYQTRRQGRAVDWIGMPEDAPELWADEIREKLNTWANWTRGHQLIRGRRHALAELQRRAADELPGDDSATGYEFTIEIEAVDKAIARMKLQAKRQSTRRRRYLLAARRVLMQTYLGRRPAFEIAESYGGSETYVKSLLFDAERYVGDLIPGLEREVARRRNSK